MNTPYVGFSNESLGKQPCVKKGTLITCSKCGGVHELECGEENGVESELTLFYKCGEELYLGAIAGKLVAGLKADFSGEI